jgi:hypothetical protein
MENVQRSERKLVGEKPKRGSLTTRTIVLEKGEDMIYSSMRIEVPSDGDVKASPPLETVDPKTH